MTMMSRIFLGSICIVCSSTLPNCEKVDMHMMFSTNGGSNGQCLE